MDYKAVYCRSIADIKEVLRNLGRAEITIQQNGETIMFYPIKEHSAPSQVILRLDIQSLNTIIYAMKEQISRYSPTIEALLKDIQRQAESEGFERGIDSDFSNREGR